MKVSWTFQARTDLVEIFEYVADDDSTRAQALLERILESEAVISALPRLGRMVPEFGVAYLRERIVAPYRVIYQVLPAEVIFLAVVHSKRDLSALDIGVR
jgi:toxin ParE1/3/4